MNTDVGPDSGYFLVPFGRSTTSPTFISTSSGSPGGYDARAVGIYSTPTHASQLFGTDSTLDAGWNAIFSMGTGLPTTTAVSSVQLSFASPWTFVFASQTAVYVADDSNIAFANVFVALSSGITWAAGTPISLDTTSPVYSLTGATNPTSGNFVLYACTSSKLYSYDTLFNLKTLIATAPANSVFRGVAMPPSVGMLAATPPTTRSATTSATASASVTRSSSATPSNTPSNSATASGTPPVTATLSFGASASKSGTQSGSPPPTFTPTRSGTHSQTPTNVSVLGAAWLGLNVTRCARTSPGRLV